MRKGRNYFFTDVTHAIMKKLSPRKARKTRKVCTTLFSLPMLLFRVFRAFRGQCFCWPMRNTNPPKKRARKIDGFFRLARREEAP